MTVIFKFDKSDGRWLLLAAMALTLATTAPSLAWAQEEAGAVTADGNQTEELEPAEVGSQDGDALAEIVSIDEKPPAPALPDDDSTTQPAPAGTPTFDQEQIEALLLSILAIQDQLNTLTDKVGLLNREMIEMQARQDENAAKLAQLCSEPAETDCGFPVPGGGEMDTPLDDGPPEIPAPTEPSLSIARDASGQPEWLERRSVDIYISEMPEGADCASVGEWLVGSVPDRLDNAFFVTVDSVVRICRPVNGAWQHFSAGSRDNAHFVKGAAQ